MLKDDATLRSLKRLNRTLKKTLIDLILVWPETESIRRDVERADTLHIVISYTNLADDADRIIQQINENPRFGQLQSKDICIELLRSLLIEMNPMLKNVDYIIFKRIKMPVLVLKNDGIDAPSVGVSASIDLAEVRVKAHRLVDFDFGTTLQNIGVLIAIVCSVYAAFIKK